MRRWMLMLAAVGVMGAGQAPNGIPLMDSPTSALSWAGYYDVVAVRCGDRDLDWGTRLLLNIQDQIATLPPYIADICNRMLLIGQRNGTRDFESTRTETCQRHPEEIMSVLDRVEAGKTPLLHR